MVFFIYILKSRQNGKYYIGSTNDLDDRIKRHNEGRSKYTKSGIPWDLVYYEEHPDRSSAVNREQKIKSRKSKDYLESLVRTSRL